MQGLVARCKELGSLKEVQISSTRGVNMQSNDELDQNAADSTQICAATVPIEHASALSPATDSSSAFGPLDSWLSAPAGMAANTATPVHPSKHLRRASAPPGIADFAAAAQSNGALSPHGKGALSPRSVAGAPGPLDKLRAWWDAKKTQTGKTASKQAKAAPSILPTMPFLEDSFENDEADATAAAFEPA